MGAVESSLPTLQNLIAQYFKDYLWITYETGLQYVMDPNRTISEKRMPVRKKEKFRLTLIFCLNDIRAEKMPLMIIWTGPSTAVFFVEQLDNNFVSTTGKIISLSIRASSLAGFTASIFTSGEPLTETFYFF